jgi:hypothetical protein
LKVYEGEFLLNSWVKYKHKNFKPRGCQNIF